MDKHQSLVENLEVFLDFVQSDDYMKMITLARTDEVVKDFIINIHMRHDSICFFQEIEEYHPRALLESHELAQIICDFVGYE